MGQTRAVEVSNKQEEEEEEGRLLYLWVLLTW